MSNQIYELEAIRFNSLLSKQYNKFATLCDQNLRYVHTSGTVDNLSSFMNKLNSGYYDYQEIDYNIVNVLEMQDCIIVTANFHAKLLVDQQPRILKNRAISIWKRQQNELRLMIYQATPYGT